MSRFPRRLTAGVSCASVLLALSPIATAGATASPAPAPLLTEAFSAAAADELFLSEYVEGSSNNKALEIFNGTGVPVDLSGYSVQVFFNGSTSAGQTLTLAGTLDAGDVYVVASSQASAAILAEADQTTGAGLWNGDDAITLRSGTAVIDSVGQVGNDPGTQWGSDLTSTADNTLRRLPSVCAGDPVADDPFDPAEQWAGFATDTVDGLGSHTADCGGEPEPVTPVLNEFSASTTGTDVEYLEVFGEPGTDYSALSVLEIEGDTGSAQGAVDGVFPVGTTDVDGFWLAELPANALENGTVSLLLVSGDPAGLTTVDADGDGALDDGLPVTVVDAVAVDDGGDGDRAYGGVVLGPNYDGVDPFAPGGASRIPDGTDTDSPGDWVRNDFDLAGIPGYEGTLEEGEARNTPGEPNEVFEAEEPPPGGACGETSTLIGAVQGSGDASPLVGQTVTVEGVVVGDFQEGGYDGYYVQDAGDGDPATSDGLFVYAPGGAAVDAGDQVRVTGSVAEFFGLTQVRASSADVCGTGGALPEPVELTLPVEDHEPFEGMSVTLPQSLAISEYFNYGRFGEIVLTVDRQLQPTAVADPGSEEAIAVRAANAAERITLDDGRSGQNPDPAIHPNGQEFTLDNRFRGGDLVTNATGVLDFRFDLWRIQPTEGADVTVANPRPAVPDVGGDVTVASFNVLNYFTTLTSEDSGARGADTPEEFERQEAKIVAAITEMDADVVGLIEIENNDDLALQTLTAALNEEAGEGSYDYVATGTIGTDAITTAFVYQPDAVAPVGDFAILTSQDDPRFLDDFNRPTLAQTFQDTASGQTFTVANNHLKSKGSSCAAVGDPEDEWAANCNGVRTDAAAAMVDWLAQDPTGTGAERQLIIGDLNSYDHEDPIDVLTDGGFTDLLLQFQGEEEYTYLFGGQLGYLDYALGNGAALESVTSADVWQINADEPSLIDYDMTFKQDAQDALYAPDPFRSSDHDPVLVGLELQAADTTAPELELAADPGTIWPPNNRMVDVVVEVTASDDSGEVDVELVDVQAQGRRAAVEQVSDTEFSVRAVNGASYTFTYRATDAAGNTTTESVSVTVTNPRRGGPTAR